jgi:hypothetical protein
LAKKAPPGPTREVTPSIESEFKERSRSVQRALVENGLYTEPGSGKIPQGNDLWRVGPEPFWLEPSEIGYLEQLGQHLLKFYQGVNHLYFESLKDRQPRWISDYLHLGKPESLIEYGRMNRFKTFLPGVLRPDLLPTDTGMVATELDSVPGGIGITGSLGQHYSRLGYQIAGGPNGMIEGFVKMIRHLMTDDPIRRTAIVVSEESRQYRPEMRWLAEALTRHGLETLLLEPKEVIFTEDHLLAKKGNELLPIDVLYRFFELFDLKNIPKAELILYSARKERVLITPPIKTYLEEKMAFAFLHHPVLETFWQQELGEETFRLLKSLVPQTWILDSRPLPPYGLIPNLRLRMRPITDWKELAKAGQKERQFVIKPSGFSDLAWGSRGVIVGHDLSQEDWAKALHSALEGFDRTPHILQDFHKGRKYTVNYYDPATDRLEPMEGRVRLSPYYFVQGEKAVLGGVLATICPIEKKLIHGMVDAVMVPCGVRSYA